MVYCPKFHVFQTRSTGEERFTWARTIRRSVISNTWSFSQHNLLEALIVTGGSAFCFGKQYRDLLLYLHQKKLDENNSNQQVHSSTAVQQYIQSMVCSHVASNSVLFAESGDITFLLFANKERSSSERRMEGGIADETSKPP